jgi:hypothetical protein
VHPLCPARTSLAKGHVALVQGTSFPERRSSTWVLPGSRAAPTCGSSCAGMEVCITWWQQQAAINNASLRSINACANNT